MKATCKTSELGIDDASNDSSDVEDDEDEDVFEIGILDDNDNDSCDWNGVLQERYIKYEWF